MVWSISSLLGLLTGSSVVSASYAPTSVTCPSGVSLVRPADGLSDNEESYRVSRKAVADIALKTVRNIIVFLIHLSLDLVPLAMF